MRIKCRCSRAAFPAGRKEGLSMLVHCCSFTIQSLKSPDQHPSFTLLPAEGSCQLLRTDSLAPYAQNSRPVKLDRIPVTFSTSPASSWKNSDKPLYTKVSNHLSFCNPNFSSSTYSSQCNKFIFTDLTIWCESQVSNSCPQHCTCLRISFIIQQESWVPRTDQGRPRKNKGEPSKSNRILFYNRKLIGSLVLIMPVEKT